MEQRFAKWSTLPRMSLVACAVLALQACGSEPSGDDGQVETAAATCLPANSSLANSPAEQVKRASKLALYIDQSQSMSGFNQGASRSVRAIGDLLTLIVDRASDYDEARFHVFGKSISEIPATEVASYGGTVPYNCRNCDNQESRLDAVLNAALASGDDTVSLILTDLWLDNASLTSSPEIALGQPLRKALQNGISVGVIGVMAPFNGAVYDVPGVGTYRGAKELPLYVLAIGPEEDIANFQITLRQSGGPAFAAGRMHYSLFSKEPNNPNIPGRLKAIGAGATNSLFNESPTLRQIDQYTLDIDVAKAQNGRLGKTVDLNGTLRDGLVWRGELAEYTNAWRLNTDADLGACGSSTWTKLDGIKGLWELRPDGESATFSFGEGIQRQLRPGNTYYLETHVGSTELAVPNAANDWMRKWSLDETNAPQLVDEGATTFKTLNLGDLTTILENELRRAAAPSRKAASFGFLLKVER